VSKVAADVLFVTGQGIAPWMASVTFGVPDLQTASIHAPAPELPMVG
jgi:gluconolactonase